MDRRVRDRLLAGQVIPAHPLVLNEKRALDVSRQAGLTSYYLESGVGGVAIGVHTTQYAIHQDVLGLYRPLLELTAAVVADHKSSSDFIKIAGLFGDKEQVVREAAFAAELGYDLGLLSMTAWSDMSEGEVLTRVRQVGEILPIFGFHPQSAIGGRYYSDHFWREFASLRSVVAIKVASFDRYETARVVRAVAEVGRASDLALYTGNDDNIVADLLTPYRYGEVEVRFVGGLLGQWAVWTDAAVALHRGVLASIAASDEMLTSALLSLGAALTDANGAIFDARNGFAGCIPGIHEVLVRQGLMAGNWCVDPDERLSPGQAEEITRVQQAYPFLTSKARLLAELPEAAASDW